MCERMEFVTLEEDSVETVVLELAPEPTDPEGYDPYDSGIYQVDLRRLKA